MLMGYDQGVYSSVVSNKDFLNKVGNPNDAELGIIVASYNLGCFAGSIFAFFFCEKLGRRWNMWVAMGWISVSSSSPFPV
jgi:MFS family permease